MCEGVRAPPDEEERSGLRAGDDRSSGLFAGPGAVRELARRIDWSATTLGPVDSWPHALRTIVRTCLDCPFPINLWCGPELLLVYNDAYADVLGRKHPEAFGRPGPEAWVEIWEQIAPMFASIPAGGPPIYAEDAPFVVERSTAGQEAPDAPNAWFTFALSAVRDDRGRIVAFLNIVTDTTDRVRAERAREGALARTERAEARLLEVFAHAPAFLAVLRGRDLIFEYVNAAHYQLTGHRELLGRPVFDALPEVRGQGFESLLEGVLATGVPYVGREVPIELARTPGAAPEQRYIDFVYYPITEADGTRSGVVSHGYDVTDHVLAPRRRRRISPRASSSPTSATRSAHRSTPSSGTRSCSSWG